MHETDNPLYAYQYNSGKYKSQLDVSITIDTVHFMTNVTGILNQMERNSKNIRFNDLCKVCNEYFGEPRQSGSSHRVYRIPWQGDPRVNIQNFKG